MLLPTKGIAADRCLITLGAEILETVERPMPLSALWESLRKSRADDADDPQADQVKITFDWFSLAVTALYAMNAVEIDDNGTLSRHHVST